ncbi:MAG: TonB-dependent receptor [Cellvibrionaceae bacterium]
MSIHPKMSLRADRCVPICLLAASIALANQASGEHMPEVLVEENHWPLSVNHTISSENLHGADTAEALKVVPGAAVNRNGGLTGIAQYRGLFGDRINVSIDSASIVSGGPNAMDAPLSYIPAALLNTLEVNRGAASVSSAQESFGGHISATSYQGEFANSDELELQSRLHSDWTQHNQGSSSSLQVIGANRHHKLGFSSSYDNADDSEFADGDINASEYERRRHDLFYGYKEGDTQLNVKVGKNNTGRSGTPALAMDITAIDSDIASFNFSTKLGDATVRWESSYSDVFHSMDNFTLRPQPMMGPRETLADGDQIAHKLQIALPTDNGEWTLGADYSDSNHSAEVTNPAMAMFSIQNFNNASREISGLFAQYRQRNEQLTWEIGARTNRVEMDSDQVSAFLGMGSNGMMNMTMMTNMAGVLANNFNNGDRSETYNNHDLVLKLGYQLSDEMTLNASLSSKQRAPSYQERYLWLPMQSTGGLADGHTYIGNLNLDSETANEVNLGVDYQTEQFSLSLQTYYKDIKDYIQGTPYQSSGVMMADNAVAMFANMMSGGNPPLQYNNVDAKIYGAEIGYRIAIDQNWSLAGNLSYVRGKRTDVSDDLYRIAPLNHRLSINYQTDQWQAALTSELFAEQDKVSQYNSEASTSGYGLLHLSANYQVSDALQLRAGLDNLTDKRYQEHLAGYNRVMGNEDIATGERLYGTGRSARVGVTYQF